MKITITVKLTKINNEKYLDVFLKMELIGVNKIYTTKLDGRHLSGIELKVSIERFIELKNL